MSQTAISDILCHNSFLKEIDYNRRFDLDTLEAIVEALAPFVGFTVEDVRPYHVARFRLAMQDGCEFVDFEDYE